MVIRLERGADLHMAQLMPLPLTVSCFTKIQIGFTFLVPAHPGSPRQRAVKRLCVCVVVRSVFVEFVVDGGRSHNTRSAGAWIHAAARRVRPSMYITFLMSCSGQL